MGKNLCYFLFMVWISYLIIASILLFTRGFLLTRQVQKTNATCVLFSELPCTEDPKFKCTETAKLENIVKTELNNAGNICLPPKSRVVLLIVDALRYDFTLYDEKNSEPLPFQNKLPIMSQVLNEYPSSSRLYKFVADPPTTTMQRLKALTTGSLPTFIDAGSNFATYEITEDNLVDQLSRNGYHTVFMGDDTWNGLYPNRFLRNYPYPSFNVWDLDTVDNGVKDNIFPELAKNDWHLLIGHFLGVDHCGHRYGPNNKEMARKLGEINEILVQVIQQLPDDTVLFVIGDHGMTVTGDHGGETSDETDAAMFVYSKLLLHNSTNSTTTKQVNLVPTLATILGVPIPFQNLGTLIIDTLPNTTSNSVLFSTWSNVQQIFNYIQTYSDTNPIFDSALLQQFKESYAKLSSKILTLTGTDDTQVLETLVDFMVGLRKMCETVWVQFDSFSMTRGLLFLFLSVFFVYVITDGIPLKILPQIFNMTSFILVSYIVMVISAIITCLLYYLKYVENLVSSVLFSTCLVTQFMLVLLVIQNWEVISINWYVRSHKERIPNVICRLVLIFNLCGLFSNSYIIEESCVLLFLLVTVILIGTIGISSKSTVVDPNTTKSRNVRFDLKWSKVKLFIIALLIASLVRSSMYFWRCRSEQQWCFDNVAPHELGGSVTSKIETTKLQWGMTVVFLAMFVIVTKVWLTNCGNLNGYSITVTIAKFLPTVIVVCIAGYWVLRRLPNNKKSSNLSSTNYLALTVYGLISSSVLILIIRPLCTYVLPNNNDSSQEQSNMIPHLFNKVKNYLFTSKNGGKSANSDDSNVPVIAGLGTAYSAVFVILGIYMTLLFALLLGDAVAPSAVIMFMTAAFLLIITSVYRIERAESIDTLFIVPNMSILIWIILSQYFFYASGHQPTFPNIAWDAAFVGTSGVFTHNFIPGTLIIINTFCSQILMGLLLPLVLIAPFTVFVMIPSVVGKRKEFYVAGQRGELLLFEHEELTTTAMFTVCCKYIAGHAIRVFASMLAATIHCRHLMVWNIFAPKLIFESIGMLVTLGAVVTGFLIFLRINNQIEKLIVKLNKMS